jgi:acyl-CoA thioesterase
VSSSVFSQQMTVERDSHPGRYCVELSPIWNCPVVPHGGLATAVAMSAAAAELDRPDQPLRSVTTVFASQVHPGPVEIDVTVLRRGKSMSQVTTTMRNPGADSGHTHVAVFGRVRPGFEFTGAVRPTVPPPDECPSFRDPPPDGWERKVVMSFWDYMEGRAALGHAPWEEYIPETAERAAWYRFDESPMLDDGRLDPLALVTMCDTMPGAVSERMGRPEVMFMPPSADLTVHVLGEARSEWILAHNRARLAGDGYASVDITLWSDGDLVAYGTQMMLFVFPEGPPSDEQRRPRTA